MLLWFVEEAGWWVYYSDSQAFTLSLSYVKSRQVAALYTLPQGSPRHAESTHGVHYRYVVGRCSVDQQIA